MTKLRIFRGLIIVSIGVVLLVLGSDIFDHSYDLVESVMKTPHDIIGDKEILQGQSINSTITWNELTEHAVLAVNVMPATGSIKLQLQDRSAQ